ncbi:MAG: CoB--CoM heterodisulfide reductase iron-sulfur subunit B family protein [Rhodospirillales bacterium]
MPENRGYLYFPGCSLRATGAAYDESLTETFRLLGIPIEELEDWNCCGATSYMAVDENSAFLLSARNLSIAAQQGGRDLMAACSACYLGLRKAQDYVEHYPEVRAKVEAGLKAAELKPFTGVKVRHALEILYNDVGVAHIKSKVVRKWQGGKIACYYGCQAVRPYDEVDNPHNPMRMDELMRAVGAETVDYPLKTKCCGGTLTGTIHDVGVRLNYILLKEAVRKGAEAIVTICPLCQFNLDAYQGEITGDQGEKFDVPVLYFTQVLGWALGGDPRKLGLKRSIAGQSKIKNWFSAKQEVASHA